MESPFTPMANPTKVGSQAWVTVKVICTEVEENGYNFALVEEPDEPVIWERAGSSKITWIS